MFLIVYYRKSIEGVYKAAERISSGNCKIKKSKNCCKNGHSDNHTLEDLFSPKG